MKSVKLLIIFNPFRILNKCIVVLAFSSFSFLAQKFLKRNKRNNRNKLTVTQV